MNPHYEDERHWQAFCYIAGELSPAERAQFEQRLEQDQLLREAVAGMVELAEAVAVAPRSTVERAVPLSWPRRVGWMLAGTAASLLAVVGARAWQAARMADQQAPPQVAWIDGATAPSLAAAWAQAVPAEVAPLEPVAEEPAAEHGLDETDAVALAEVEVPGWMLAALSQSQAEQPNLPGSAAGETR